jgi:hypothetical protein
VLCDQHNLLFNRYPVSLQGVKRPGHEAEHSYASRAEVKNGWSYTSTPPVYLHALHRDYLNLKKVSIFRSLFNVYLGAMYEYLTSIVHVLRASVH